MHNRFMPPGRPLSTTTREVLDYLRAHPGATVATIANALNLNFKTVASIIRRHGKDK